MTTDGRDGSQSLQPELPLAAPLTEASPRSAPSGHTRRTARPARTGSAPGTPTSTRSRRLNEQTRRIGRQGVAAARAQLEGTATAARQNHPEGDSRPAGRAA